MLAGKGVGRHCTAQHVDVGIGEKVAGPTRIRDLCALCALPGPAGRGLGGSIRCARAVGAGRGRHALHRHTEVGPGGGGGALLQVQAADHAVDVGGHMDMAQSRRAARKRRPGHFWRVGGHAVAAAHQRQHHAPAALQGLRQKQVVFGVVEVFLVEQNVQPDGARFLCGQLCDQLRMQRAAPGPAANGSDAAVVDGHHHDIGVRGPLRELQADVLHQVVDAVQRRRRTEPGHQPQQRAGQKAPLQPPPLAPVACDGQHRCAARVPGTAVVGGAGFCGLAQRGPTGWPPEVVTGKPLPVRRPAPTRIWRGGEKSLCSPVASST